PALGRVFSEEEDQPGNSQVVVLNDSLWMRRFGGDTNVVGRTLRLDGQSVTVIGVMPPGFEHPLLWGNIDLWRPMAFSQEQRLDRGNNGLQAFGRLKPGVPLTKAEAEMKAIAARMGKEHPMNALDSLRLEPLQRQVTDEIGRKVSWFTFGLAGFVLLIACANLGNLQLVRTATRAREFRRATGPAPETIADRKCDGFVAGGCAWLAARRVDQSNHWTPAFHRFVRGGLEA
ncbi:MAG: permease, partial [Verrucomicrobia bacterium]